MNFIFAVCFKMNHSIACIREFGSDFERRIKSIWTIGHRKERIKNNHGICRGREKMKKANNNTRTWHLTVSRTPSDKSRVKDSNASLTEEGRSISYKWERKSDFRVCMWCGDEKLWEKLSWFSTEYGQIRRMWEEGKLLSMVGKDETK